MYETFRVYEKVNRYLSRDMSLGELNRWLASVLPQLFQLPPGDPYRGLASEVIFRLAQMDEGLLDENKFSQIIREYLSSHPPVVITTGQSGKSLELVMASSSWDPVREIKPDVPLLEKGSV